MVCERFGGSSMFTGIVETTATLAELRPGGAGVYRLRLTGAGDVAADAAMGASIAVSGVCLTVAGVAAGELAFDVVRETLDRSTLGGLRTGARVNLERALPAGGRLDGHFVQGHVDGTAVVTRVIATSREHVLWFRPDAGLLDYVIPKGSIAIDGVSLTIASVKPPESSVALIPTTLDRTTLSGVRVGDRVNIETDILARTIVYHLRNMVGGGGELPSAVTRESLARAGFA